MDKKSKLEIKKFKKKLPISSSLSSFNISNLKKMKILLSSLLHLVILSACSTWIPFVHTTAAQLFNPFVVDNVEHACDVSTNTGCMNGGICMSVFMPGGIPNSRCVCPPGLVRPNCDFPRQAEIHHCNHYCPEGKFLHLWFHLLN